MDAVKLAIENRERTFWILVRKGVDSREAAIVARESHTTLPSEDRQPVLEPYQAPLGQPAHPLGEDWAVKILSCDFEEKEGPALEQQCLTRALSRYHDLYLKR